MPLDLNEPVPQDIVDDVINFSDKVKAEALAAGKYQGFPFRYEGELRNHGPMLVRYTRAHCFGNTALNDVFSTGIR